MICIIALIVFGVLGIFSAKYRIIAKEAWNCVFKKITLRKCDTDLNQRLKGEITGKFLRINPHIGRVVYRYFEVFSWVFLILTVATLFFVGQGIYFYMIYGNCNGPNSNQFCIFDPLGANKPANETGSVCAIPGHLQNATLKVPPIGELSHDFYKGDLNASVVIIEFGCYSCHFTGIAEPTVKKIINHYDGKILYIYKDFPLSATHENALLAAQAAHCALNQNKYWEYRDYLFANQPKQYYDDLVMYAKELELDIDEFKDCLKSEDILDIVTQNYQEGLGSGITVTPTFFVNNQTIIGAKDYKEFKRVIDKELGLTLWQKLFG